ncbi:MAG: beta-lactamase family protein [Undibacterium sp.]|nr:beta-lactamase family protein [Opitutaceae bacterium]
MRLAIAALFIVGADLFAAAADPAIEARITRIENGLLPAARIAGRPDEPWTLAARMKHYGVPGVSIAVINDGHLEWARGYGLARAGDAASVTADTLFQAASLSKSVTAVAALSLVEAGQLDLDADVNTRLTSWKILAAPIAAGAPVTLRQLLSHTAGLMVHGFAGYAPDSPRPTLLQILNGTSPANSKPIRLDQKPGAKWRYSGGGYCVVQQLLLDVTKIDFPTLLRERVLVPAGMTASTFAQPLPAPLVAHAAAGHRADGSRVEGDAHAYPELAAAGLWTTPTDLAAFLLSLQHALAGQPAPLSRASVETMLDVPIPGSDMGLGIGVRGTGEKLLLSHSGANEGFRCIYVAYPRTGRGAVIMTNSDEAGPLFPEILRALAREYAWPDYLVAEKTAAPLDPVAFDAYRGIYQREETRLAFFRKDDRFYVQAVDEERQEIFPSSDREFFRLDSPRTYAFQRNADGDVTHVIRREGSAQIFQRVR